MPDQPTSLDNIYSRLGELTGLVKGLTGELQRDRELARQREERIADELKNDREEAREGRARLYARIESLDKDLGITNQIAVQARDKAAAVEKTVLDDVKPQTDKIRNLGIKGGGIIAALALVGGLGGSQAAAAVSTFIEKLMK